MNDIQSTALTCAVNYCIQVNSKHTQIKVNNIASSTFISSLLILVHMYGLKKKHQTLI